MPPALRESVKSNLTPSRPSLGQDNADKLFRALDTLRVRRAIEDAPAPCRFLWKVQPMFLKKELEATGDDPWIRCLMEDVVNVDVS